MFLVVWKHAQMHQNTFLSTADAIKYLFYGHVSAGLEACAIASKHIFDHCRRKNIKKFLVVWKHAQMHQNTFLTTPGIKKHLFQGHVSGGLEACENALKHGFNHSRRKIFFFLVVWKHAQMPQNAFLTTPDVEKYLF
jgi:hypothetical protein